MKVALAGFAQESHSFSPVPGSWIHFGPRETLVGPQIFAELGGTRSEVGGMLDAAEARGVELLPAFLAMASASAGVMKREVFAAILQELLIHLRRVGKVDGVLLVLHGSMVAEGYPDATGEILRTVRMEVGSRVPVVATLDLHANVTQAMVSQATALVGYHTAPHVDMYETGQRAMNLLYATMRGKVRPVTALCRLPMILPGEAARSTDGPYAEVIQQAQALMRQAGILDAAVFCVQPWLDVPDLGCATLVVADGDKGLALREAQKLADAFWARRRCFQVDLAPLAESVARALASERGPWILADSADAPTSGAPGDSTVLLQALLTAQPTLPCLLNIVDPPAVAAMIAAGVGESVTVEVGAKLAPTLYSPVTVTGQVKLISDGEFVQKGPGFQGALCQRGRTGVLKIGQIYLVVMERPVRQWDPELYRSLGLEPREARIVQVKSPAAFRAAYGPLAAEILLIDTPGVCSPNLRSFPFRHVPRPLYPLDDPADWRPVA